MLGPWPLVFSEDLHLLEIIGVEVFEFLTEVPHQGRVHKEFLHVYLDFDLVLIMHLAQVQYVLMPNYLVLIMRK